ncbi:putative inactive disease susceptibility protein LOV1 [Prunus yedoensis var. nudiflora]|uniref:Putative inactive disease susceptibility protein LOV1 n=1 Tax=Prunus yedoensis var. nudiflora TaxID=2094558 RepID=A0A314UNF6_PRUYE|nr:putative inactive disease susceptibility protein LOV1 [Prunus yedoensis var. nudiflora]
MSLGTKISDLLETKERYGFKFITGRSSNFARKSPRQQTSEYQARSIAANKQRVIVVCQRNEQGVGAHA